MLNLVALRVRPNSIGLPLRLSGLDSDLGVGEGGLVEGSTLAIGLVGVDLGVVATFKSAANMTA